MWNITVEEIKKNTDSIIHLINENYREVLNIPKNERTFFNTIEKPAKLFHTLEPSINKINFLQFVHPNDEIREASKNANIILDEYFLDLEMREDLFQLAVDIDNSKPDLDYIDRRYLDKILLDGKRSGMYEDEKTRNKISELSKDMIKLSSDFSSNVINDDTTALFNESELVGVSQQFLDSLDTKEDILENKEIGKTTKKFIIPMQRPYISSIMENAKNEETRKKIDFINKTRCSSNIKILYDLICVRKQHATLLKYNTFADFVLEKRMAKNPKTVNDFLQNLYGKLKLLRDKELDVMKSIKKNTLYTWDLLYYEQIIKRSKFNIDNNAIKQYFVLDHVLDVMFKKYQEFFEIYISKTNNTELWHKDAVEYRVLSKKKELLGTFILDPFPRNGKYEHYACFPITSRIISNGITQTPAECILVGNFTPSSGLTPSLLKHSEIETLFHEFGHVIHNILGGTKYSVFSGTSVEWDFVETPSQMLENLCWEPDIIKELSKHWKTNERLPDDTITMLISTRYLNSGLNYCKQILYSSIDQIIHKDTINSAEEMNNIYNDLSKEMLNLSDQPGTADLSLFTHLVSGYAASYYGYLWSEVYADDIYSVLSKNPDKWAEYCQKILSRGGTRDAQDMLYDFLQREPNDMAFLRTIGFS